MRKPKYRKKSGRDFAFVEFEGTRHRLPGRYNSAESLAAYRAFLQTNCPEPVAHLPGCICETLRLRWLDYCEARYGRDPRGEYANCSHATRPFRDEFGTLPASEFSPRKLKRHQQSLLNGREPSYVNWCVARVKRMFKWGVSEELVPETVYRALCTVAGLPTKKKRKPGISEAEVFAYLPHLRPSMAGVVQLLWYTGARTQSCRLAHADQFDTERRIWYPRHKEEESFDLALPIGPRCLEALGPYLQRGGFLFPSSRGPHYEATSVGTAVRKASRKHGLKYWTPHLLRHAKATLVRREFGEEAASAILGHARLDTTRIYGERQLTLARKVAEAMG